MGARTPLHTAGQPSSAADPVARRIRRMRLTRGMTLARLAERATKALAPFSGRGRRRSVSTSYVSLIENGRKVPDEAVAVAIGRALADDLRIYRAWVRTLKRADLATALESAKLLERLLSGEAREPVRPARRTGRSSAAAASAARLRIPVIDRNDEPGDGVRPACDVIEWLRFDLVTLEPGQRERLDRPFAFRLDEPSVRRVRGRVRDGTYGVVLRQFMPIEGERLYAVRYEEEVVVSRALWNGSSLLLMPADGESDFAVIDIGSETLLGRHVVGEVVLVPRDRTD